MPTKSEIIVDSNNTYVPNTSGLITPQQVQTLNTNWINASIFPEQTGSMSVRSAATASFLLGSIASASYAAQADSASVAVSSSFALTASFALNVPATSSFAISASFAQSASLATRNLITASAAANILTFTKGDGTTFNVTIAQSGSVLSASFADTANFANSATSASYAFTASSATNAANSISASYAFTASSATNAANSISASFATSASRAISAATAVSATTATSALTSISASFATFAATAGTTTGGATLSGNNTFSGVNTFNNSVTMSNVQVNGTASIAFLNVVFQSSSVIYSSGSNQFGDASNDTQTLYGTVNVITGPLVVTGSANFASVITGSISTALSANTASYVANAFVSASNYLTQDTLVLFAANGAQSLVTIDNVANANTAISASFATTAGTANSAVSASFATSASLAQNALTASFLLGTVASASFAISASRAISAESATSSSFATNATSATSASYAFTASSAISASFASVAATVLGTITSASFAISASRAISAETATSASFATSATSASTALSANSSTTSLSGSSILIDNYNGINSTYYLTMVDNSSGYKRVGLDTDLSYNPSTNILSATVQSAATASALDLINRTPATVRIYPTFANAAGVQQLGIDTNLYFESGSLVGLINSASFATSASRATSAASATSASFATNASTASVLLGAVVSSSYAFTASSAEKAFEAVSSSYALTASFASTASFLLGSIASASFAETSITASFATNFVNSGSYVITGSHRGNVVSQSIASSTASFDFSTGNFFTLNLTGSTLTHISASNIQAGQTVNVRISQGATTGSVNFSPAFYQVSGSAYTPTAVANAVDILTFITFDNSLIYVSNIKNLV
jgi:hypothetical protein